MEELEKQLEEAFSYAVKRNSFSKVSLVEQADHVCVFGLGKYFEDAFFRQNIRQRFRVDYLCDNRKERLNELKDDSRLENMQFCLPEELKDIKNPVVILMLGDPRSAIEQLAPIVGKENCITYNDLILDDIMDAKKHLEYYIAQRENLLNAFHALADEESKKIFVNIFCLRVAPHLADYSYEELCSEPQYFPSDIVKLSEHETVIDCGAYDGDTLQVFADLTEQKFEKYFAFEIDSTNFRNLEKNAEKISKENVICCPYGVWSETKMIQYGTMSSSDSYSIFNESETEQAKVVCLDEFLKEKKATCSLIKMDIEGAEMEALKGCSEIVKSEHPKMAICIYHRVEDLWQIPLYLKSLYQDYQIYVRHHAKFWVSETVCYAIPKNS